MLIKLIKYEFKATAKFMLTLFAVLGIVSALTALLFYLNQNSKIDWGIGFLNTTINSSNILGVIGVLASVACVFLNIAAVTAMFFYSANRFRTNLLGDEGYLMNTLPVKAYQNILSKFIVSIVWTIAGLAACAASCFILSFGTIGTDIIRELFIFSQNIDFSDISAVLKAVLILVVGIIQFYCQLYAAMTFGYSFNKHRALLSVASYIVLGILEAIFRTVIINILYLFISRNIVTHIYPDIATVIEALSAVLMFLLSAYCLKHKLNLQ